MRLWHQYIINSLPDKQLLGQHRELCALRGLGFGKKHSIVNYVFYYPYYYLYKFHLLVMKQMKKRNFKVNKIWYIRTYRGKNICFDNSKFTKRTRVNRLIYKEHNIEYLKECLINLNNKNISLKVKRNSYLFNILFKNNLLFLVELID